MATPGDTGDAAAPLPLGATDDPAHDPDGTGELQGAFLVTNRPLVNMNGGYVVRLIQPVDFMAEPMAVTTMAHDVPIFRTRIGVPLVWSKCKVVGATALVSETSAPAELTMPAVPRLMPLDESERQDWIEQLEHVKRQIIEIREQIRTRSPALAATNAQIDLRTLELRALWLAEGLANSMIPMHAPLLEQALQLRTDFEPTARLIRLSRREDPDLRGPCEVAGHVLNFPILCTSSDLLFTPYIAAYDRRIANRSDRSVAAKFQHAMRDYQPGAVLARVADYFGQNIEVMFPLLSRVQIDAATADRMRYGSAWRDRQVRLVSLGLLPLVLLFFDFRMQRLNPVGEVGDWLVTRFTLLRDTHFPERVHAEMINQLAHNVEWAKRYLHYHDAMVTHVWQPLQVARDVQNIYYTRVMEFYTRALEAKINDVQFTRTLLANTAAALQQTGMAPLTEREILELAGRAPFDADDARAAGGTNANNDSLPRGSDDTLRAHVPDRGQKRGRIVYATRGKADDGQAAKRQRAVSAPEALATSADGSRSAFMDEEEMS